MDAKLVMFKNNGQRKDFPLGRPVTVIGRAESCDLRIPLSSVSRRHCQISVSGNKVKAKDLQSSNGTFVNNERVDQVELNPGDRLVVGPVIFTLQVDGVPEEVSPPRRQPPQKPQPESEEIVELEANVIPESDQDEEPIPIALESDSLRPEDHDPIAALEALAAETEEDEEKSKKDKKS